MGTIAEVFRTGGPALYMLLALALLAMPLGTIGGLFSLFSKRRLALLSIGVLSTLVFLAILATTGLGVLFEMQTFKRLTLTATPENLPKLLERHNHALDNMVVFGGICVAMITPGVVALFKGMLQPKAVKVK